MIDDPYADYADNDEIESEDDTNEKEGEDNLVKNSSMIQSDMDAFIFTGKFNNDFVFSDFYDEF